MVVQVEVETISGRETDGLKGKKYASVWNILELWRSLHAVGIGSIKYDCLAGGNELQW
jgi:hypothetical protein